MTTQNNGSLALTSRGRSARLRLVGVWLALGVACQTATPVETFAPRPVPTASAGTNASEPETGGAGGGATEPTPAEAGGGAVTDGGSSGAGPSTPDGPDAAEACGPRPTSDQPFSRAALREAAADCAIWHYCYFDSAAQALSEAVAQLKDAPSSDAHARAQRAWSVAMERWSRAELFQFGPAGSKAETAGRDPVHGQGLRDLIYAWPLVGRCRVEEQVATGSYARAWSLVPISARGLFGLEYLLFYAGADHACSPSSATGKAWAALDTQALDSSKRDYAAALGADIATQARSLREAWSPDGGDFRRTLANATGYENEQQAMNVIAWSLLYVERELKDWKLGIPAGVTLTHPVTQAEAAFARQEAAQLRANLAGFRALFQGCGDAGLGLGFDDWLNEVGQGELSRAMLDALDDAEAAAAKLTDFEAAPQAELRRVYDQVRVLTSLLKADFFGPGSTLNLKLPAGVASDTD
jgi:uncharacterized protein